MSQKSGKAPNKKSLKKNANPSSMSNRSKSRKKTGKEKEAVRPIVKQIFTQADLSSGPLMADEMLGKLLGNVDHIITVNETVKKLPDYNANLTVEQILWSSALRLITPD